MGRESMPQEGKNHVQVQQVRLVCHPERVLLQSLADEAESRFTSAGSPATILLYGVSPKRREGFVILEAARGIPFDLHQWLEADERVLDYTVNDVASIQQERDAFPASWYQSHLPAPALPTGYAPLAGPASIDLPGDERWLGLVAGDEGEGMLFYEEKRPLLFLTIEESLRATLQFYRMTGTLLDFCDSGFVQAHARDLATLRRDLSMRTSSAEEAQDA
jgi:hypothetical protein